MLTAAALAFVINIAGAAFNWIYKEAGRFTTQVVLFMVALIAAGWYTYGNNFPGIGMYLGIALTIFSLAVTFYEVLLKYFPLFSGPNSTQG